MSCARLVPWLCSRPQPGIKVIVRGLRGHLLHTVTFLVLFFYFKFGFIVKKFHLLGPSPPTNPPPPTPTPKKNFFFYYTPPHFSGGVLCFHVGRPCVCPSVYPSVRTSFPFDNLSIYKRISFKFCICICIKNVSLRIVNGQISIIWHRVMALVNGQKMVFGP